MNEKIVRISTQESIKLHLLSFIFGLYLIVKALVKWAWDPKRFFALQQRDKPPPCLIDNNLGTHSYVKIQGVKFHYVESGDKNNPLLLLLHGFPDCWLSWREQIPILARHYRVIAIDLKGFGDSDKPTNCACYDIERLIDELKQFIQVSGVETCTIIGHDLGGLLGWYFTALHGSMITKFIAIASPHPNIYWDYFSSNSVLDKKWIHFSRLPILPEMDALKEDLSIINHTFKHLPISRTVNTDNYVEAYKYAFSRKVLELLNMDLYQTCNPNGKKYIPKHIRNVFKNIFFRPGTTRILLTMMERIHGISIEDWTGAINYYRTLPFTRLNVNAYQHIRTKMLLMIGNLDSSVTMESIVRSTEYARELNLKVITGAHHFPHQEKPEIVNRFMIEFLIDDSTDSEKNASKSSKSLWLESWTNTFKYSSQIFNAVQRKTHGVTDALPSRIFFSGQHAE